MAGKKTSMRFVVEIDGQLRRLFSIQDKGNKGLNITTHIAGLANFEGGMQRIKESRFSVHVSPNSPANTFHSTTVLEDRTRVERYLATTAIRSGRFQPLYARSVIRPSSLPTLELPVKGPVIKLRTFNPEKFTMIYALWVSRPATGISFDADLPFDIERHVFEEFEVFIPYCFNRQPSPPHGNLVEYATTTEQKRSFEHAALGNRVGPSEGAPSTAVIGYIVRDFNRLAKMPYGVQGLERDPGPLVPQFANFLRNPV